MNKIIKIVLIIAAALVALFITACVVLVLTVDPNDYKTEISQKVKETTGRELVFEGDIGFNFFPWLGLNIGPTALGNAPGFEPAEMVRINRAEASIRILPLLSGNVTVGKVVLDGLTVNLAKNAKGVTNWDDLAKGSDETAKPAATEDKTSDGGSGGKLNELSVEGVEITNANIVFDDRQAGKKTEIADLNLIVGEVGDKVRFPFELRFRIRLDDPKVDTQPVLTGFARLDKDAGTVELDELKLTALNLEVTGLFFAKSKDNATAFSGELKLAQLSLKELLRELSMEPPATADPKALEAVSADLKFNGTDNSVALERMTVKLDDTTVTADGSVSDFSKPAMVFNLNVDAIDADRYLPPKAESAETKQAQPATAGGDEAPAQEPDLSALKDLNLKAKLTLGKLKVMNLTITDILAQIVARNGVLTANPVSLKLYEGSYVAEGRLDANPAVATWAEKGQVSNIQIGPPLKDLMGKDQLYGTTNAKYDLTGSGLTPDNIKRSVTGTASFAVTDGAINGINVAKMLRDGWNQLKGQPAGPDEPVRTDFAELLGSATLDHGVIRNNDLLMKSPLLRVTGEGWANLPKNNTDYTATVTVVGTLEGQDGKSIEDLKGLPLPVRVKGDLNEPDISLDLKAMGEALFKGTFKKGTKDLENTLKSNILGGSKSSTTGGTTGTTGGTTEGTTGTTTKEKPKNPLKGLFQ